MGGWSTVIVFLTGTFLSISYRIDYSTNMPDSNGWTLPKKGSFDPQPEYYDGLTEAESTKPLFSNIFLVPPVNFEHTSENIERNSKITSKGFSPSEKNLVTAKYEESRIPYDYFNKAALEKAAEARVEEEYYRQRDVSRNRRENTEEINEAYQNPAESKYSTVKLVEDHRGESSDYGHHNYIPYNEEESHFESDEPKKKKEIHYHQHKHLHEHDHLQDHNHQHLDEHKDKHNHEHKQHDDHKHYHQAKHEHKEKEEHYHKNHADHKHQHYQGHKHDHKDEHWHEHKQEAQHDHKDKHEHIHKEDSKHYHEKKAEHGHHHHHKHEEEDKHHHNHWAEHKHGHNHHHDAKHYHHIVKVHHKKH